MHFAVRFGDVAILEYLMDRGANMHILAKDNKLPLHYACETNNFDAIKLFFEIKGNVEAKGGKV